MDGTSAAEKPVTETMNPSEAPATEEATSQRTSEGSRTPTEPTAQALSPASKMERSAVQMKVDRLKKQQAELRAAKKRITAELRNATKTKSRLKKRAKLLTDADLLEVIQLRRDEKAARAQGDADASEPTADSMEQQGSPATSSSASGSTSLPQQSIGERFDE